MSAKHFKRVCSCGTVLAQCRCPDPAKTVEVVQNGCPSCLNKLIHGSDGYEVRVKTQVQIEPAVVLVEKDPPLCMVTLEPVAICRHCANT